MEPRTFGQRAIAERARLALADPEGEAEAVIPLPPAAAYGILRRQPAREVARGTGGSGDDDLLVRLGADPTRDKGRVPCPAHGGRDANLAWRLTPEGKVLLTCHSHRCSFSEIVAAVR